MHLLIPHSGYLVEQLALIVGVGRSHHLSREGHVELLERILDLGGTEAFRLLRFGKSTSIHEVQPLLPMPGSAQQDGKPL